MQIHVSDLCPFAIVTAEVENETIIVVVNETLLKRQHGITANQLAELVREYDYAQTISHDIQGRPFRHGLPGDTQADEAGGY